MIRAAAEPEVAELAKHGAYLTDGKGNPLSSGRTSIYVVWPHVAMRHPKYNGGIDSGLNRARAEQWGFVMRGKGTDVQRRLMIANAAKDLLRPE